MSAKEILFDAKARERLAAGVDKLANAVKVTLGPKATATFLLKNHTARPLSPKTAFLSPKKSSLKINLKTWVRSSCVMSLPKPMKQPVTEQPPLPFWLKPFTMKA